MGPGQDRCLLLGRCSGDVLVYEPCSFVSCDFVVFLRRQFKFVVMCSRSFVGLII